MQAGLYLVPLPIGNLGDMSFRAIETLKSADQIWAEDTRNLRKILSYFDIPKKPSELMACHDHNEAEMSERLVDAVKGGLRVAYVSDAGMPIISDPGFRLVQKAQEAGIYYTALPGPSAVPTALALSSMPSDRFAFLGFVPTKDAKRREFYENVAQLGMTAIAFESAKRVRESLNMAREVLGGAAKAAIVREISKTFEEVIAGNLGEILERVEAGGIKGEVVLVFAPVEKSILSDAEIIEELQQLSGQMRLKEAVQWVAKSHGLPRKRVYQLALTHINQDE